MSTEIHTVGPFILGKSLGSGATGKVKLGFHKETGFKVAVKIINKEFLASRPSMRKKVEREIVIMKLLDHPNVLRLYDVYETSKYLFLVLEYVEGGELFDYLVGKGSLEPAEALMFFQQLIIGLDHCHNNLICHRDLKPENILLLEGEKKVKIADFGMASLMRRNTLLSTSCGSPHYASPEVVMGSKYNGMLADVWSCGVILFALLSGKLPFDDDNIRKLLAKVKSGQYSMPVYLPKEAQDIIAKMLAVDPVKRISVEDIKKHPWFLSNSPSPQFLKPSTSIDSISADPLEDLSMIDDDILRSLKALGLGTELDLQLLLTSKKSSVIIVLYRLLQKRKDVQESNNFYPVASRGRNRSQTTSDRERLTLSGGIPLTDAGKTRANSLFNNNNNASGQNVKGRTSVRSFSSHTPSPLASTKGQTVGSEGFLAISTQLTPPDGANPSTTSTTSPSLSQEQLYNGFSPPTSPTQTHYKRQATHRGSLDANSSSLYNDFRSPPTSPPTSHLSQSTPINLPEKFRKLKITTDNLPPSPSPGSSPIIGSLPKRSWFSNFFTGSPQSSPRDPAVFTITTLMDGDDLTDEIQRALTALNANWDTDGGNLYSATYKSVDGTEVDFNMEIMDGKTKQNTDARVVVITLEKGPTHYFNFLCSLFRNEAHLDKS